MFELFKHMHDITKLILNMPNARLWQVPPRRARVEGRGSGVGSALRSSRHTRPGLKRLRATSQVDRERSTVLCMYNDTVDNT